VRASNALASVMSSGLIGLDRSSSGWMESASISIDIDSQIIIRFEMATQVILIIQ
jgi:hypothetical protein